MVKNNPEKLYQEAVKIAELISTEMTWLYANHQVFQAGGEKDILEKMTNTYSGHIWKLVRRANLNEIHLVLYKLLDKDSKAASIFTLKTKIQDKDVMDLLEKNYSQGAGTFQYRLNLFEKALSKLDEYMRDHKSLVRKLIRHRNNYLAHRQIKPYSGDYSLKIGDEKELIEIVSEVLEPMENLFLNKGNVSHSINSPYRLYSKNFWHTLSPEREKNNF